MILRIAFWSLSLSVALVSLRFLFIPIDQVMVHMLHYLPDHSLSVYAHMIGGPVALALAPVQLWQGLRRRRPALHRASGYIYATAVVLAGLASLWMLPGFEGQGWVAAGFAALALCWIASTGLGIYHARQGHHRAHQIWMQRSIALTIAAVTLRLIMAPLMSMGWSVTETYQVTAWGSWVLNLAALELWRATAAKPQAKQARHPAPVH